MTNREEGTEMTQLVWKSKDTWGTVGRSHYTSIVIGGLTWTITVDSPQKGEWQVRGWLQGAFALYRDKIPTLKQAKEVAEAFLRDDAKGES